MRKSIFETYGETPIKDVLTPRRPIDFATGREEEDDNVQVVTIGGGDPELAQSRMEVEVLNDMYALMVSVRLLLIALVVIKLITLIRK